MVLLLLLVKNFFCSLLYHCIYNFCLDLFSLRRWSAFSHFYFISAVSELDLDWLISCGKFTQLLTLHCHLWPAEKRKALQSSFSAFCKFYHYSVCFWRVKCQIMENGKINALIKSTTNYKWLYNLSLKSVQMLRVDCFRNFRTSVC